MSNFGIKVSRPGFDVLSASDSNTVLNSNLNTFKICRMVHFTAAGSVAHGLTYPPAFIAFKELNDQFGIITDADELVGAEGGYLFGGVSYVSVDSTNVYSYTDDEVWVLILTDALNE